MDQMKVAEPMKMSPNDLIMGLTREEFFKLSASMLITVLHRRSEGVMPELMQAAAVWSTMGAKIQPVEDQFQGHIDLTRGMMARQFLSYCVEHPEVDKIVMIDNDEAIPIEAPFRLAMWDKPVVSGVMCSYNENRGVFACFTMKDRYGAPRFPSVRYTGKLPTRGLLKVYGVGTGLVCIQKKVLETIFDAGENPFEVPKAIRDKAFQSGILKEGEDTSFSKQCERLGFDRYVDLSVHGVHYKPVGICWPTTGFDDDMDAADFKVDVRDYLHG